MRERRKEEEAPEESLTSVAKFGRKVVVVVGAVGSRGLAVMIVVVVVVVVVVTMVDAACIEIGSYRRGSSGGREGERELSNKRGEWASEKNVISASSFLDARPLFSRRVGERERT